MMSDSRELAHGGEPSRQEVTQSRTSIPPDQRMMMLREALTNPEVDPAKARAMFELMGEMEDRERQAEFNRDKAAAIRAMPAIFKRGQNTHTGNLYAKFEDMHRAAMPVLRAHNLSLDFRIGSEGRDITVQPILRHDNGFVEEGGVMKGPADEGKGRTPIQAIGSASSYLKRYSMRAMLNLIEDGEDDDGVGIGRDDYQLNDRQQGLLVDAQAAADRGEYATFYEQRNARDKAILVRSGLHAQLGGVRPLIGSTTTDRPSNESRDATPAPAVTDKAKRSPAQMVDDYILKLQDDDQIADRDDYQGLQDDTAKWQDNLRERYPDLWQKVSEANQRRWAELPARQQS